MQALGAYLRERREAMGVTLAEVEVATRIRQKYLSALEADEWYLLPGEVVGRGFLRNYADYLGLDPSEVMERRRAVTDSNLNAALATTSAGAPLPPERDVDYRPKEVDLKDETDDIEQSEIRLTPILAIVALAVLVGLGWWGINAFGVPMVEMLAGSQTRVASLFDRPERDAGEIVINPGEDLGVVNEQNVTGQGEAGDAAADPALTDAAGMTETLPVATPDMIALGSGAQDAGSEEVAPPVEPPASDPPAATGDEPPAVEPPAANDPLAALIPTNTPDAAAAAADTAPADTAPVEGAPVATPEAPTPTPEPPTPTPEPPTPTPEPLPTEAPTPEPPPPVAAAACSDGRAVISGPGAGQVVSGIVGVSGTAQHESFQYYKLEYAPGAWAAGGYVYFDGSNSQVIGGLLGNLDTGVLPNGDYTIRLTVVDQTGNFPPPCDVAIVVQN